ncbi:MAG TPA: thiamine-phosphate kinase [Actinomycetota bacterium]
MDISEQALLTAIRRVLSGAGAEVVVGVGDDAAVVAPGSGQLVLTNDVLTEGTHFVIALTTARDLGYKAIVTSVSDVAAMAGAPRYALDALTLTEHVDAAWVMELFGGMREACEEHAVWLVGGNLTRGTQLSIATTVVGEVAPGRAVTRSGAGVGDRLVVTGALGASSAGRRLATLRTMPTPEQRAAIIRHQRPIARVGEAGVLARYGATAMIDVSDGFSLDVSRLAEASGVGLRIQLEDLPIASEATREDALAGGEDYELIATLPTEAAVLEARLALDDAFGVTLTDVGEVTERGPVTIDVDGNETPLQAEGWDPFSEIVP